MKKGQKKGISTVLTTLIIVVASVVLGTAVTLFGTSLFQSGTQTQSITVKNLHLWQGVNATSNENMVLGAVVARNTGDKIIALDSIKVRGTETPFGSWFAGIESDYTSADVETKQLAYVESIDGATNLDGVAGNELTTGLIQQTGPVSLEPGKSAIIYFIMPNSNSGSGDPVITATDVGGSTSVNVFAGTLGQVVSVSVGKNT